MNKLPRLMPGDIVRHFKNEFSNDANTYMYKIIAFGYHTETKEPMVVYQALYDTGEIYIRPYDMFMSKVDRDKYPDARQEYRFEKAGSVIYNG